MLFNVFKMFPFSIKLHIYYLLIILLLSLAYGQDRKITPKLNPGCDSCTNKTTLIYIKADGNEDTIHQIWDFSRNLPTMIIFVGTLNSTINIEWERNQPSKFTMNEQPQYSFATVLDKLYEYDDLDDKGHIEASCPQREHSFRRMSWTMNASVLTDKEVMVDMQGRFNNDRHEGVVKIRLDLLPFKDYASDLPHLIHTANSTLVDISLVNLTMSRSYNASRYAVHLVLLSMDDWKDTMHYVMRKSLDDEHTPGVFEIMEIKSPSSYNKDAGGYLQFRPVAYTARDRNVASSTIAHVSDFNKTSIPKHSTMQIFYSTFDETNLLVQDMFVSFGEAGDGYYKAHNYTAWSYTVGYGRPPTEGFSTFVIAIISVGLGLPAALTLSAAAVLLARRRALRNAARHAPRRFTDED